MSDFDHVLGYCGDLVRRVSRRRGGEKRAETASERETQQAERPVKHGKVGSKHDNVVESRHGQYRDLGIKQRAASDPGLPAIKQGEITLSYAILDTAVARCATILSARGVTAGDRVAMIMPNVAYFPIVYYAILRIGAIAVPMNPLLKAGEISFVWNDCDVKVAVVFPLFAEEAAKAASATGTEVILTVPGEFDAELARTEPTDGVAAQSGDETAVILYTSGTTGRPKGAELTHANLSSNVHTTIDTLLPMAPGDVIFGGLPLFHSFGQTVGLNAAMAGGACLTLLPKFDGEQALSIISNDRVTIFLGVPTMYMGLLAVKNKERFDTSTLKVAALRRIIAAGRGVARRRAGIRLRDARGLWTLRDLASRVVQPPGPAQQAGLDRNTHSWR